MRKHLFLITTIIWSLFSACTGSDKESADKKDSSEEAKDSSDTDEGSETGESEKSEKNQLLTSLVGKHPLQSISGLMGANSMFDFYKSNEDWMAEGSANEGGMREGYDIDLSDSQKEKLKSMSIVVSEDLKVSLVMNGKTEIEIPFNEKLMEFKTDPEKEYIKFEVIPAGLSSENTVFNGWNYLLVRDDFSESKMKNIDITEMINPDFICIKVSKDLKEFQMELRLGDCCDNAVYTFKK